MASWAAALVILAGFAAAVYLVVHGHPWFAFLFLLAASSVNVKG